MRGVYTFFAYSGKCMMYCSRFFSTFYNFFVMSKFTKFTAPAMTFDCFCMSQSAYRCISRIAPPRNTERGAMSVFQISFPRRGVYSFSM